MSAFPGPVPPETNPPINPQYYQPRQYFISALTTGTTTTVTTSVNNDFVIGQLVRLLIPFTYGCTQLNQVTGYVISIISPSQLILNIDSSNADQFIPTPVYGPTKPQIIPVGDVNSGPINSQGRINNGTFIEGSFINISPN